MSNIFRDPTEGATARRQDLLRRRREELVMMPHAIRRVYIARRARTIASLVVVLAGFLFLVTAASPGLARWFASGLPGINPAVLSTMIVGMWLTVLFSYAAARAIDEHRFAVAMSKLVMPSKDLAQDIERLSHEHPDQAARDMAHRFEVRSAALPVLAASVLLPVTALYIVHSIRVGGWPVIAEFEASVVVHAKQLLASAAIGCVTALVMTRRFARLPSMLPIAGALSVAAATLALVWWPALAGAALVAGTVALVARRLRIERVQLETEDPAAGSEIFTIRGMLRSMRSAGAVVHRELKKRPRATMTGAFTIGMTIFFFWAASSKPPTSNQVNIHTSVAPVITPMSPAAPKQSVTRTWPSGASYKVEATSDGSLLVKVTAVDLRTLEINSLHGLATIPHGWTRTLMISLESGPGYVEITAHGSNHIAPVELGQPRTFSATACGQEDVSIGLNATPSQQGEYVLRVRPILTPASC